MNTLLHEISRSHTSDSGNSYWQLHFSARYLWCVAICHSVFIIRVLEKSAASLIVPKAITKKNVFTGSERGGSGFIVLFADSREALHDHHAGE